MKVCRRCGVTVLGEGEICPLCHSVIVEKGGACPVETEGYPDIAAKTKHLKRGVTIASYFLTLIEIILIIINYYTFSHVRWSVITGVTIFYVILTMWELLNTHSSHIRKLYAQAVMVFLLLLFIDVGLGYSGWSLEYGIPCVILAFDLIILVCMAINHHNWQNYILMQLFAAICSLINLVLYLTGVVHQRILVWVTVGISVIFWSSTVILGGRKAENEMKRKFHV